MGRIMRPGSHSSCKKPRDARASQCKRRSFAIGIQTPGEITEAMRNGTMRKHVDGVNALQAVPWRINERVLKLVERSAGFR